MKTNTQKNKGFTLIELIMVTIILGILAAVAIPRYVATVSQAEAAAENAVISSIKSGLETYATEQLMENGRRSWPDNPFDALETKPVGYNSDKGYPTLDGEWTHDGGMEVAHMRGDNTVASWDYTKGIQIGPTAAVGNISGRTHPNPD